MERASRPERGRSGSGEPGAGGRADRERGRQERRWSSAPYVRPRSGWMSEGARVRSPQVPVVAAQAPAEDDSRTHRPSRRTPPRARFTPRGRRTPSRRPRTPRTGPGTPPSRRQRTPTRNRTGADPRAGVRAERRRGLGGTGGRRADPGGGRPAAELPRHRSPRPRLPGASTELLADPFAEDEAPPWQPDEWSPDQWNPETAAEPMAPSTAPEPFLPAPGPDGRRPPSKRARPRRSGLRVSDVGAGRRPDAGPGAARTGRRRWRTPTPS